MNRYTLILAAALLSTVSGAYAQTSGEPDNDWLMKHPVPSGERSVAKMPRTDTMQMGSTETGAAASAKANFTPPPVGSLDSSYGRP